MAAAAIVVVAVVVVVEIFSAMPTHVLNISAKFYSNTATKCKEFASHGIRVHAQRMDKATTQTVVGRTDGPDYFREIILTDFMPSLIGAS